MRWSHRILIAAGCAYALYAIRVLSLMRYTTVHGDFWLIYDHLLQIPFPNNVLVADNGHSIILPSLVFLANLHVFRGNETSLFVFALALLVSIAALLVQAAVRDPRLGSSERCLLVVTALTATFWLIKLQILISAGFTIICAFPIVGLLLGARSLTSIDVDTPRRPARWWAVWAGASMATFSFGTGLAAWPALGLIAWARGEPWRNLRAWCLGMGICTLLVVRILPDWFPEGNEPHSSIVVAPLETLKYWLQLLGSPWANTWAGMTHATDSEPMLGFWFGIAGVSLGAWGSLRAWKRRRDLARAEWIGATLVFFSAFAAGLIAIGRTDFFRYFPQDVFSSRYLWWTTYFWLGLIWVFARSGHPRPAFQARLHSFLAVLLLAGLWPAHRSMLKQYQRERAETEFIVTSLASGLPYPSFFLPSFVDRLKIFRLDAILREKRLAYYARDGYRSVGERLDEWFVPTSKTESARMRPNHFYASLVEKKRAVRFSGWLEEGPADLILLTDVKGVVRGLGSFVAGRQPFSGREENFFNAFAPATEPGSGYQIWAVRGRESRRVIPGPGSSEVD